MKVLTKILIVLAVLVVLLGIAAGVLYFWPPLTTMRANTRRSFH